MKPEICDRCKNPVSQTDKFCQSCGSPVEQKEASNEPLSDGPKTFVSKGNYSGKMVKGKTPRGRKIFRNIIIAIILIGIIAIIIWYRTDPNAGEKLGNILFGAVVMVLFGSYIWWRGKKGTIKASRKREATYDHDDINEPEVDSDDD